MTQEVEAELVLAAEDCEPASFDNLHKFDTRWDHRTLTTLVAHGPVLLRGGRGSGKSAFMIAASRQLDPFVPGASAVGIYMSLRHAPLLRSTGDAYGKLLCEIIIRNVKDTLRDRAHDFDPAPEVDDVQYALSNLSGILKKRIVLYFDDAAHLGREASLEEFFDIYRTLSSSAVSCKAAIYPGVTRFGVRFDVYNDATVINLLRNEELPGFAETFTAVMAARYPDAFPDSVFSASLTRETIASFMAQATLGNMRGFVFACNALKARIVGRPTIGLPELGSTLLDLSENYYWPLLEEIEPKLGMYEKMVETSRRVAEILFGEAAQKPRSPRDILIHKEIDGRLAKPLQILEYAGMLSKREASRAMKSGGRGARYTMNLCSLLEQTRGARLTRDLFDRWVSPDREEAIQLAKSSRLSEVALPQLPDSSEIRIFGEPIEVLKKSRAYPYGLSQQKIEALGHAGFTAVRDLADASDDQLDRVPSVGDVTVQRIRNVLGQAIWM